MRDILQIPNVQALQTTLSCETSVKFQLFKLCKRSFPARHPSNSNCSSFANKAFVRDILQILKVEIVKVTPELAVPLRGRFENDPPLSERVPKASAGQASPHIIRDTLCPAKYTSSCIRYMAKTHFVRDVLQIPSVEALKTKLSCETSFKFQLFKLCKQSFRARHPLNSNCSSFANEAFVRDILQIPTAQACAVSFQFQDLQAFRHPDFQTFKLSDIQTFRHPDFQTSKLSDIQTFRHPGF